MMLSIKNFENVALSDVLALSVYEWQLPFVGDTEEIISKKQKGNHFYVVALDDMVVGFFVIEIDNNNKYEFLMKTDLHLAIFFIDKKFQGRGIGKESCSLIYQFLKQTFPDYESVVLTVNCMNPAAYNCYVSSGFTDTMQLYHGGSAGPQHILRLSLHS